jgi:CxxC-x17-CxxC domain-containing protein
MPKDITLIAQTNFRGGETKFGIKRTDRRQHMYVIGKTGTGKTQFLKNMALQDIENGEGLAIVDPHGEFVEEVLESIPEHRINDVVYFNPADMNFPVSFNIMDVPDPKYKHLIASGLIGIFTKIWANVWSARMEYILANCILALLDTPGTTLLGIPRMLVDRDYRQKIINNLKDPVVKSFWINEYEEWESRYRNEAIAPVQNKVGQFLNVSFVRNIVGQAKNTIDIDEIMNSGKILLVNVSKGRIGEDNAAILGAMIITKIQLSAMERVRIPEDERRDFYLYVDEFQNFATDSFKNILSEARKYRLNLVMAHQYIGQLVTDTSTAVRDAVFGNCGTLLSFRVGAQDAEFLEQEFTPEFLQTDLIRLDNRNIYLKLMIDGITSRPFSARTITIPPIAKDDKKREEIIRITRQKYARTVETVEQEINNWAANIDITDVPQKNPDISNSQNTVKFSNKPKLQQGQHQAGHLQQDGTMLYDAVCSNCGKATKVIFPPESGRAVYCKSCLKKLKAGEIHPAHSEKPDSSADRQEKSHGSAQPAKHASALADLGIEFGPAQKIGNVSFNNPRPDKSRRHFDGPATISPKANLGGNQEKPKRREINLSDLKKALEESLSKKDEPEKNSVTSSLRGGEADVAIHSKNDEHDKKDSKKDADAKKKIKPGETIKL